jgi:hypothetical protein
MQHKRAILILVFTLALPVRASADDFGNMFGVMFRMMLTMMNVMSDVVDDDSWGNNRGSWGNNWNNWGGWPGMSPWSSGFGGMPFGSGLTAWPLWSGMSGLGGWPGMSPWSSGPGGMPMNTMGLSPWSGPLAANSWSAPFAGTPYTGAFNPAAMPGPGVPGRLSGPPVGTPLDGRWYGSTGEILEIRGDSFRLQNALTTINGSARVTGNVITMFSPRTGTSTQYTFIGDGNDLLLRDATGQVVSFHRNPAKGALHVF